MTKPPKKYTVIGLRRDKNFSDLNDKVEGLNNLLNNIDGTGTFLTEDLNCIRGLYNEKVTANNLYDLASVTIFTSPLSGSDPVIADPLITLKDRIDNARLISGIVPSYNGGEGLEARFVRSNKVRTGNSASTGANIFDPDTTNDIPKEIFWERGHFRYASKIDPAFTDVFGGIQWEGYFSPYTKDPLPTVYIATTGCFIMEWDEFENGQYKTLINIYAKEREITPTVNSSDNTITTSAAHAKFVAVNDIIKNSNPKVTVTAVDRNTNVITLSSTYTSTTSANVVFTRTIGDTQIESYGVFKPVEPGKMHKVRFTYWFPVITDPVEFGLIKSKEIRFAYIGTEFFFTYLYKNKPPVTPGPYEVRQFLKDATTPYQPKIGDTGSYKNLNLAGSFISYYVPKPALSDIRTAGPYTISVSNNDNVIASSGEVTNVKIGNFVVPNSYADYVTLGANRNMQIKGEFNSSFHRYLTENFSNTASGSVNFIDHRGLVGWYFANTAGDVMTFSPTTGVREKYIVVSTVNTSFLRAASANAVSPTNSITFTTNTGIKVGQIVTRAGAIQTDTVVTAIVGNTVTLSKLTTSNISVTNTVLFAPNTNFLRVKSVNSTALVASEYLGDSNQTNTIIYIYADKSLIDTSKDIFCAGVFGQVVNTTASSGTTTITLNSNSGITAGLWVQLFGYIQDDTKVNSISGNVITISKTTTGAIPAGTTLTFTNSNVNKEACVIPLDTSPPFFGTSVGLNTGGGRGLKSAASVTNFQVVANKLSANVTTSITSITGVQKFNRKLPIYTSGGTTYSVLANTS